MSRDGIRNHLVLVHHKISHTCNGQLTVCAHLSHLYPNTSMTYSLENNTSILVGEFEMKDLGDLQNFLGYSSTYISTKIPMHVYIEFGMTNF